MGLPIVAVIGCPNVGKSTFVNRIAQTNDAIVDETRGVTRDRSYHRAEWNGVDFTIIDTGGIEMVDDDRFQASIRSQAFFAVEEADAIIFLVDGHGLPTHDDLEIAKILRSKECPVFLAVNKMDNTSDESPIWEFVSLGLGDPWPVSALHGHGTGDLLDAVVKCLPKYEEPQDDESTIDVAIIGRPNAGKSSLLNRMIGEDRSIISDVAGTTRDAIDALVEHDGRKYRFIDTAGIRKKSAIDEDIEYYSFVRALRTIERASVALLLIDSSLGLTDIDQRVANMAKERGCALVILLNKWDAVDTIEEREAIKERVGDRMMYVGYAPVLPISALTGRSTSRIWDIIDAVFANYSCKISTSKLNNFLEEIRETGFTITQGKKRLKMNYVTQTRTCPPSFTFFVNHPDIVEDNFERFLENRMRQKFDLSGTPIRLFFKHKG